ncbi:MAG: hypothetical protein Q9160_005827 [Pyrenula sp. 1 TL-2023]
MSRNTRFAANYASYTRTSNLEDTATSNSFDNNNRSYVVPELPNLSELVTGTYHDGTPVFARNRTTKPSRFAAKQSTSTWTIGHKELDAVPVPDDEKQIFAMLKLLREKVSNLEKQNAEAERRAEDAEIELELQRNEKKDRYRFRRSDSALGTSDDEAVGRAQSKLTADKTRLEVSLSSMQSKLEASKRQTSIAELTVKNVSKERDSALAQLSTAFLTSEELKVENEALRKENKSLRLQLGLEKAADNRPTQTTSRHHTKRAISNEVQAANTSKAQAEQYQKFHQAALKTSPQKRQNAKISTRVNDQHSKMGDQHEQDLFSINVPGRSIENADFRYTNSRERRKKKVVIEVDATDSQEDIPHQQAPGVILPQNNELTDGQDITNLTILDPAFILKVRQDVEQERQRRKQAKGLTGLREDNGKEEAKRDRNHRANSAPPADPQPGQKFVSKNDLMRRNHVQTAAPTQAHNTDDDDDAGQDADMSTNLDLTENLTRHLVELNRRASDPTATAQSNISRRRARPNNDWTDENMTSGFFLPDVTIARLTKDQEPESQNVCTERENAQQHLSTDKDNIQRFTSVAKEHSQRHSSGVKEPAEYHLSEAARAVLKTVSPHNKANCTICKRVTGPFESHTHDGKHAIRDTIRIPAIVPPSLRAPAPTADNPDPTIRPAQPPRVALAVVVKELNDEVAHLKEELAALQARYHQTDPSLSRRERKSILEKIQELQRQCEIRSDQIYKLSDVAEGQPDGTAVEVTIGLNDIVVEPSM